MVSGSITFKVKETDTRLLKNTIPENLVFLLINQYKLNFTASIISKRHISVSH